MSIKSFQYIGSLALVLFGLPSLAQQGVLPVLQAPASAESLAKGATTMGNSTSGFIYNNPAAIFNKDTQFSVDYSLGLFPTEDKTMHLHTVSTAYKQGKSAFFIGGRYFSMGNITALWDSEMNPISNGRTLDLYSYALDLGYAYKLSDSFVAYAKAGYANERMISDIKAYHSTFGVFYNGSINKTNYSIGVEASNLGVYKYKDKTESLPSLLKVGGAVEFSIRESQVLEVASNYGVFLPNGDQKAKSHFNIGANYTFWNKYSILAGTHLGEKNDYLTAGLGLKHKGVRVHLASKLAARTDLENAYMLDIGYSF
ncbi:PorV/PorQ family protein [Myroides odoratimimus]|uniref:PorV/PorQ family protein n=1 Tax=Myroides odoratimimus TaxID=76832 RepID=UPI001CE195D9|nr:PorV/PorQ family protein [Myroides odoratimimus]MCA4806967.1 PorV/PorQ family protein [Myroides odoratimimus]